MKRYLIFFLTILSPLISATVEWDNSKPDAPILDSLNGILLVGSWNQVRKEPVDDVRCVLAEGVNLLRRNPDFVRELEDQYIGQPLTQRTIWDIKDKIARFYRSKNQPLVVVSIPRQELTKCILQVVVEEAKLGKVTLQGNCYFPSRWFNDAIRTNPGDPIITQDILADVAWLNLNPFRRTDAIFKPGDKPGTTDIELVTIDRWPYRVYMGGDNTGTISTNRNRLFFGFNFGKSVLKDGQISYQFTFAPNWNLFYSHTASARLPLPWRHVWVLWGGYSEVKPHTGTPSMKNRGVSWQVDSRYRIPVFSSPDVLQTFVFGYDFKETNNNILFEGTEIFKANADINQLMFGYEFGYRNKETRVSLVAEAYGNPGGITYANKTKFYELLRFDAKNKYLYFKMAHSFAKGCKYGWITYDITGQASTSNLLPSEQFTMTGYNAVRGYEERVLNLDNALIVNFALETPHFSPARTFGLCRTWDELYLLAFFDYGLGGNHQPAPAEAHFRNLASVGPGIRYQIDRYFTARFDYGFQLWHTGFDNPTKSRYNFGMILSY
jgi:hemolysin activation/secretion protein